MNKLVLMVIWFLVSGPMIRAQSAHVTIKDTIHYFFNKYYFKTGVTSQNFPLYNSVATTASAVTHVGCIFENNDTLDILGLEAFVHRHIDCTSPANVAIPFGLYLCNVTSSGTPIMPPIDSVKLGLSMAQIPLSIPPVGGSFSQPRRLTGRYAVLMRNMSQNSGDTILLKRTSGMTFTSSAASVLKHSDSYGVARLGNTFYITTNFTEPEFGYSTDYEFCLAPRVQYTVQASMKKPLDTMFCTSQIVTYTNTSSKRLSERMYNLIEFRHAWNQNPVFNPNIQPPCFFPPEERGLQWSTYCSELSLPFYLLPNSNLINIVQDSVCCDEQSQFLARLFGTTYYGGCSKFSYFESFKFCTQICWQGISEHNKLSNVVLFPNPSEGTIQLNGLPSGSMLEIYDMTGQLLLVRNPEAPKATLDLSAFVKGNYVLRIGVSGAAKTFHILTMD